MRVLLSSAGSIEGRLFLSAVLWLVASACASNPETRTYDIVLSRPENSDARAEGTVHLLELAVPGYLEEPGIFYRPSRYEAGRYAYHEWIRPLSEALRRELLSYLRGSEIFEEVLSPEVPAQAGADACFFRIEIEAFEEIDRGPEENDAWLARAALRLNMSDLEGSFRREFLLEEEVPVSQRNAHGVVKALNHAFDLLAGRIAQALTVFIEEAKKKQE